MLQEAVYQTSVLGSQQLKTHSQPKSSLQEFPEMGRGRATAESGAVVD